VVVTLRGHPLCGETLQVDLRVAARGDGFVQVVLPDGSRTLLRIEWTDAQGERDVNANELRFTRDGLRRLLRVVNALSRAP
jgi:YD repeat-containing protein